MEMVDFVNATSYTASVTIADLNMDNWLDMIVTEEEFESLYVFLNDGTGKFPTKLQLGYGAYPQIIGVSDFNEDGRLDIGGISQDFSNVIILLNTC